MSGKAMDFENADGEYCFEVSRQNPSCTSTVSAKPRSGSGSGDTMAVLTTFSVQVATGTEYVYERQPLRRPGSGGPRPAHDDGALDQEASGSYLQEVRTVGLKVLKNKLSEYVRLASGGETVLIADRDRVVAELVPPSPGRAQTVSDAVLAALVREGIVTPAMLPPGTRPRALKPVASLEQVMAELDADRAER